jgi:hypothetical protein
MTSIHRPSYASSHFPNLHFYLLLFLVLVSIFLDLFYSIFHDEDHEKDAGDGNTDIVESLGEFQDDKGTPHRFGNLKFVIEKKGEEEKNNDETDVSGHTLKRWR